MAIVQVKLLFIVIIMEFSILVVLADSACPDKCQCSRDILGGLHVSCISLTERDIVHIPPTTSILTITDSSFSTLRNGTFLELPSLKELEMSNCAIETIEHDALLGLDSMKSAKFNGNKIRTLPAFLVSLPNLEYVYMRKNAISSLQLHSVGKATVHSPYFSLDVSGNSIRDISEKDLFPFRKVEKLSLDLTNNNISTIHPKAFLPVKRFEILRLQDNNVKGSIFTRLQHTKVEILHLKRCQIDIAQLNASVLRPLRDADMRILSLQGNKIPSVSPDAFQSLPVIENLDLSMCEMDAFPSSTGALSLTLKVLDIGLNHISGIDLFQTIGLSFPNLEKLIAQHNQFVTIRPIHFPFLTHLRVIDLSYNRLYGYLNFTMLPALQELYLNGLFSSLPLPYAHLALHTLIVQNMSTLVKLHFKDNKAYVMRTRSNPSSIFEGLGQLRDLDLSGNSLFLNWKDMPLPNIFRSGLSVRRLSLASNSLYKLPVDIFSKVPNLENLDISDNNLQSLDSAFGTLTSLLYLNLRKNKLITLDMTVLYQNTRLISLNIESNQFSCTCESSWFSEWLRRSTMTIKGATQKCADPVEYQKIDLQDFEPPWISCKNHLTIVVFICIGTGLLIIAAVASLVAYFRWDITYWWHLRNINRRRHGYIQCENGRPLFEYDAFVAHNSTDERWVVREFLPRVEGQGQGQCQGQDIIFNVCIHSRNFLPGDYIIDSIVEKMEASKVVILIISRQFLQSNWCRYEVDLAQSKVLQERRKAVIVIFLENIPHDQLPKTIAVMRRHVTYLEWPADGNEQKKEEFWKKLKLSLLKRTRQIDNELHLDETQL